MAFKVFVLVTLLELGIGFVLDGLPGGDATLTGLLFAPIRPTLSHQYGWIFLVVAHEGFINGSVHHGEIGHKCIPMSSSPLRA